MMVFDLIVDLIQLFLDFDLLSLIITREFGVALLAESAQRAIFVDSA